MPLVTTYNQWVAVVTNLVSGATAPSPFLTAELPAAIDYAEGRIYREFNLLELVTTDASQTTQPNSRDVAIPSEIIVINNINVITPANNQPNAGTRVQLTKTSKAFLDFMWPSSFTVGVPSLYAIVSNSAIIVGPWANNTYVVEYEGTIQPAPLSSANPTTFLTLNIPDLFLAATMIHISGYMKNFGQQADNPQMAVSWESQYQILSKSVDGQELRRRYANTAAMPLPGFDSYRPQQQAQSGAA